MPARVVALGGLKGSGKSEARKLLQRVYPNSQHYAFATPLKRGCQEMYGFSDEQMYGALKDQMDPRYNCSPRMILKQTGDDQRARFPQLFVSRFLEFYEQYCHKTDLIIVDDWRLPVEGEALLKLGATLVLIDRGDLNQLPRDHTHDTENVESLQKHFEGRCALVFNHSNSRTQFLIDLLEVMPLDVPGESLIFGK